jgi:ribosomal protein L32
MCQATPAMVLGITEERWAQMAASAVASGLVTCSECGFEQYRNHDLCVKCSGIGWD